MISNDAKKTMFWSVFSEPVAIILHSANPGPDGTNAVIKTEQVRAQLDVSDHVRNAGRIEIELPDKTTVTHIAVQNARTGTFLASMPLLEPVTVARGGILRLNPGDLVLAFDD